MSHVDDGQLHAYLDGALPGGLEARRQLEAHVETCDDCRALLDAARADREGASDVLGLLDPTEVGVPPFEQVLARRGVGETGADTSRPRFSPATLAFARAAVVLVALGAGWIARGVVNAPDGSAPVAQVALAERPQETVAAPPATAPAAEPAPEPPAAATPQQEARAPAALERPAEVADAALEEAVPAGRQAVRSADAPPSALGLAARAARPAATPARTDELVEQANAADAAPAPASPPQVVGGLASIDAAAVAGAAWTDTNPAEATARLGRALLEIEGLPWSRMELAQVDGAVLVRTIHPLGDVEVELVQGAPPTRVATQAAAESRANGPALAGQRDGLGFLLRGADADTLAGLAARLR